MVRSSGPAAAAALAAAVALIASAQGARAEPEPESEPPAREVSRGRRALAVGAAIVPGVVVRGAGSWVVGERRAARRLFGVAAVGAALAVAGGAVVALSGGAPESLPAVPLLLVGTGLVVPTWFADIWVAAGGARLDGRPRAIAPWSLELGTWWLRDPFRQRGLARAAATVDAGRLGFGAGALVDAQGAASTFDGEARWRFLGAAPTGAPIADGSRLFVRAGLRRHRDAVDDVTLVTGEAELVGRLDLRHLDRALDNTFVEATAGVGVERAAYPNGEHDLSSVMLGRFSGGVYLGARGEATIFYDHRRDSLAGGLAAYRASGFFGSVGGAVDVRVAGPWAVRASLEVGNAWVTAFALRYYGGAR